MGGMIPEDLDIYIHGQAERSGYQVVDISTRGGKGTFFEVTLDKEGGISLDECGEFNRNVSAWIDSRNLFDGGYTLDVCSPGLDRILKSRGDFAWAAGRQVQVTTHQPVEGESLLTGKLVEGNLEDGVTLELDGGGKVRIDSGNIARTRMHAAI